MDGTQDVHGAVAAVVVSFDAGPLLRRTVEHLVGQVAQIIVVDNGSADVETLRVLEELSEVPACVMRNPRNRGIGAALNQGVAEVARQGFSWVLTMDHDSLAAPGMVSSLLSVGMSAPTAAICAPRSILLDDETPKATAVEPLDLQFIHTSGNLVRVDDWLRVGGFREDFFVDYVDYEFCWKVRQAGRRIISVSDAILRHRFAYKSVTQMLGRSVTCTNYSPTRRYYQTRNALFLARTIGEVSFARAATGSFVRELSKVVLLEARKHEKLFAMAQGLRDGLLGRLGPRP